WHPGAPPAPAPPAPDPGSPARAGTAPWRPERRGSRGAPSSPPRGPTGPRGGAPGAGTPRRVGGRPARRDRPPSGCAAGSSGPGAGGRSSPRTSAEVVAAGRAIRGGGGVRQSGCIIQQPLALPSLRVRARGAPGTPSSGDLLAGREGDLIGHRAGTDRVGRL